MYIISELWKNLYIPGVIGIFLDQPPFVSKYFLAYILPALTPTDQMGLSATSLK